jgi:hypothetical protein
MSNLGASNLNLNLNLGAQDLSRGAGGGGRARFNTPAFPKMTDPTLDVVPAPPYPPFPTLWDPDLRSYFYLQEFIEKNPTWFTILNNEALASGRKPADKMSKSELTLAMQQLIEAAPEREERFAEIIDQADAEGAINYWLGMLMIDPARHPYTYLMVRVARRVGEMVVMCLKEKHKAPRPSQLCPMIVPMIDPPATPSFPAGHALQSFLISHCLFDALKNIPQSAKPTGSSPGTGLFALAYRVADNRLIAGLHFQVDNDAGAAVAEKCLALLNNGTEYPKLATAVQGEFPQYK